MMIKRRVLKYAGLGVLAAAILFFSGCSVSGASGALAAPAIRAIGLPDASIVDSVTLKVTGPDMDPVEVSYSRLPSVINIAVPEGNDRTFELTVGLSSTFTSNPAVTYTSFKGTATADVTSDSAVVTLNMGIGSTKIIVPDPQWNSGSNPRVLQFSDIGGKDQASLSGAELVIVSGSSGWSSNFYPYDIDFDSDGRIYIANKNASSGYGRVFRIDSILGSGYFPYKDWATDIVALAIDRSNDILYYATTNNVYSSKLDGTNDINRVLPLVGASTITSISSLAVDSAGMLYMIADAGQAGVDYQVLKFNPVNDPLVLSGQSITLPGNSSMGPKDLLIKGGSIYVANAGGGNGYQILELSISDLSLIEHYGNSVSTVNVSQGNFYGPRRFAAQINDEITIIDDYDSNFANGFNFDKLIQMDNINGDNWITLPASGASDETGQTLFEFFTHNTGV